jgi:hypothetical protein
MGVLSGRRGVCQKIVYFAEIFDFNETPRFPLYAWGHTESR